MTSQIRNIALAALVAVASLAPALHAQHSSIHARVDVPFSFDYGTTHFGRGTYVISMNDGALVVRNSITSQSAMVIARFDESSMPANASLVTFKKYGDRWFLENVQIAGNTTSVSAYQSKAERQAEQLLASRGQEATQVALALLPEGGFGK